MNLSLRANMRASVNEVEKVTQEGYLPREHSTEMATLLTSYFHIQQKMQTLLTLSSEIDAEMKVIQGTLATLQAGVPQEKAWQLPFDRPDSSPSALYVTCFGRFVVHYQGHPINLCSNRNGQAILRFLVAQSDHSASTDTLMDLLWPEDTADVALRKLHVTLSILRNSLRRNCHFPSQFILHKHGIYQFDPAITLHSDVEEFLALYTAGQKATGSLAVSRFENACALYTRPFLVEDLYASWSSGAREQLRQTYLHMSSAISSYYLERQIYDTAVQWAMKIIKENACDEAAHCQLMRIYALQGRRNDALRQYRSCRQMLREELSMQPLPETEALYQAILQGNLEHTAFDQ